MTVRTEVLTHSYMPGAAMLPETIGFPFLDADDVIVTHIAAATGVRTVLAPYTGYTIAGDGPAGTATVTATAAWPAGDTFEIGRDTELTQKVEINPGVPLPSKDVEQVLDRVTMGAQEARRAVAEVGGRALQVPAGETATPLPPAAQRAGRFLAGLPGGGFAFSVGTGADAGLRTDLASPIGIDMIGAPGETLGDLIDRIVAATIPQAVMAMASLELMPEPLTTLHPTFAAAAAQGATKTVIIGDSIATPSDLAIANSPAEIMIAQRQAAMPHIRQTFVNLSLPGWNMQALANAAFVAPGSFVIGAPAPGSPNVHYWPDGSTNGVSWLGHAQAEAPDEVQLWLSENDVDDPLQFSINLATVLNAMAAWAKPPMVTLVCGAIATKLAAPYAAQQRGRQGIAEVMRHKATLNGCELVDVNASWRLLRDGVRTEVRPRGEERDFAGWGDDTKWGVTGAFVKVGTAITGAGRAQRRLFARDGRASYTYTLGGAGSIALIDFREFPDRGGLKIQIDFSDQGGGNGYARLYYRSEAVIAAGVVPARVAGTVSIVLDCDGPRIRLYVDNWRTPVLSYDTHDGSFEGLWAFGTAAGTATLDHFTFNPAPEAPVCSPLQAEAALLGDAPPSFGANPLATGDGRHHPSTDGVFKAYAIAIVQHAKRLARALRQPVTQSRQSTAALSSVADPTVLNDLAITISVPSPRWVNVRLRFGYKNPNAAPGVVGVRLDGASPSGGVFYLEPTAGTNNRQLSFDLPIYVTRGTHVFDAVLGGSPGAAPMTSTGDANLRQLTVTAVPA